jgi:hypothetical protein
VSVVAVPEGRPCERCRSPLEVGDLRCAVCALLVAEDVAPVAREQVSILRCTWCGAAIRFDPAHQAPACAFCRSVMTIEQPHDPVEAARVKVPFEVSRELAMAALRTWLGERGWFAPPALRDEAVLESATPLYWAAWIVDARATVAWTADSDHGHERSRWAPHGGEVALAFDQLVVPASRGLTSAECNDLAAFYDLSVREPLADGDVCESFDAQRSAARAQVHRAIEREARTRVQPSIPGKRFRNIRVACLLERQQTDRVALPAYVLAYRYRGATYRAIVHGQRADVVLGKSPLDRRKLALLVAALLAAVIAGLLVALKLGS